MRKGPIFILIGIAMAFLSVPLLLGFTLYDHRTISTYEFDEEYWGEGDVELTYTFEDVRPGKLTISSRSFLSDETLEVSITDEDRGRVVSDFEMDPGLFRWEKKETKIRDGGDYRLSIIVDEEERWLIEITAQYSANYSTLGLLSAVLGFPIFLLIGIVGICYGSIKVYRKRRGIEGGMVLTYDDQYEEHISYGEKMDQRREEYDDYETSPRRKELWFGPPRNPYDNLPDDYFQQKRKESQAFGRKWHQKWGDELEDRLTWRDRDLSDRRKEAGVTKGQKKE